MDRSALVKEAIRKAYEEAEIKKQETLKPDTYCYTPEMGEEKPDCQMESKYSYDGKHLYIDTPLEIMGRGITFLRKYSPKDFISKNNRKIGWNQYKVTRMAYKKLEQQYAISMKCYLN